MGSPDSTQCLSIAAAAAVRNRVVCLQWAWRGQPTDSVTGSDRDPARDCAQPCFRETAAQAILKALEICSMAKLVFGMNQSLDGYVDHMAFAPGPTLFRHFIEEAQGQAGSIYGRRMYEVMRYWDDDDPEWDADEQAFAVAWRNQPKWVVSRSLKSVGPNARLIGSN